MRYYAGECKFYKMDFQILPHVLRVYQPVEHCSGDFQPGIDFSRGYPEIWDLSFTDISFPSQHMIDGKRYDAEVVLSHTYSVENGKRLVRKAMLSRNLVAKQEREAAHLLTLRQSHFCNRLATLPSC